VQARVPATCPLHYLEGWLCTTLKGGYALRKPVANKSCSRAHAQMHTCKPSFDCPRQAMPPKKVGGQQLFCTVVCQHQTVCPIGKACQRQKMLRQLCRSRGRATHLERTHHDGRLCRSRACHTS